MVCLVTLLLAPFVGAVCYNESITIVEAYWLQQNPKAGRIGRMLRFLYRRGLAET